MHPQIHRLLSGKPATLICGLALALTACTGGSGQPSAGASSGAPSASGSTAAATAPANAQLCADAAAVRASVAQLANVTVAPGLADEIKTDLANVKSSLTALVNHAQGQWQAQISALQSALDQLQAAVEKMVASPGSGGAADAVAARDQVRTAAQNLLAALSPACGSASAAPSG
jgi:hypothetical protein